MPQLPAKSVSYWIDTTPDTDYPILKEGISVDAAVIGGGIAGLSAAALLKKAGLKVALLEARRIVQGVTGYTTAKITSQHRLIYRSLESRFGEEGARAYGEANQAGLELITDWVKQKKIDCDFRRKSAYVYTLAKSELPQIEAEVKAAAKANLPASFVTTTTLPFKIEGAVCFTDQAEFHPRKYLLALAQEISGDGSYVFEDTNVRNVKDGSPCEVKTSRGKLMAKEVIIATHAPIIDRYYYYLRMAPKFSYALGVMIQGETPDGMFIGTRSEWPSIRSHPTPDGELLIVVGEGHKTGQGGDTLARYQRLEKFTEAHFRVRSVDYRWSTQDNMPHDGVPFIGKFKSSSKHIYVATGFQAWGMSNGVAAAIILSDMILGKKNPWAWLFNPTRVKPFLTKKMVTENLNSAGYLVGDRLNLGESTSPDQLGKREGKILRYQGKKVAAYRDGEGTLHTLSPICPHMKCTVHWNDAEKTWDCPCHGSRFDGKGRMFHGPSVPNLKKME